jgi:capsular polysaccharide transport system permease protein
MYIEALRSQVRVINALMLREARTRYGRQKVGYLWALIEPIVQILVFSYLFYLIGRVNPFGGSMAVFLATGLMTFFGFRNVMNRVKGGFGSNEALLSFPIVKVVDCYFARALLELGTWIAVTVLILGGLIFLGLGSAPRSVPIMAMALLCLFALALGAGMTLAVISEFLPALSNLMKMPNRILYMTSGGFFLPDSLPPVARNILTWNPVLHGITLFRVGYYPLYDSHMLSIPYLVGWSVGALFVGLTAERLTRKTILSLS